MGEPPITAELEFIAGGGRGGAARRGGDVLGAALAEAIGAREVSFLIADFSGLTVA